jgi:hypothetical protein
MGRNRTTKTVRRKPTMKKYQTFKRIAKATIHETIAGIRFLYNEINPRHTPPKYKQFQNRCGNCGKPIDNKYEKCYKCAKPQLTAPPYTPMGET